MTSNEPDELEAAEQAAAAADAAVARVHQALLAGDGSAAPTDLVDAESNRNRARQALEAIRRIADERAQRKAEAERVSRLALLDRLITTSFGAHEGGIVDAYDDARAALERLCVAVGEHNAALAEITADLADLEPLPAHLAPRDGHLRITDADVTVHSVSAEKLIAEAAVRAASATDQRVPEIGRAASLQADATAAKRYGLDQNPDGTWPRVGVSDELRRTAKIVAERDSQRAG